MAIMAATASATTNAASSQAGSGRARAHLDQWASLADEPEIQTGSPYDRAPWPEPNRDPSLGAINAQGRPLPVALGGERRLAGPAPQAGRVTILVFWATWAGPSLRAVDVVSGVAQLHGRRAQAIAIAGQDERRSAVQAYLAENNMPCIVAIDEKQGVYRGLDVQAIPHAVVLSTDGVVRWQGNPLDPRFPEAVYRVVEADPGVARRKPRPAPVE